MAKVIGIDPGKTTGIAIALDGKISQLATTDFWGCIEQLQIHDDASVVIELPGTKHVWHDGALTKRAIQRTGVNVGSCIREAELLVKWLHMNERNYIIQKPRGKLTSIQFNRLTGWSNRSNQHERDAGVLCYGLTINSKRETILEYLNG